MEFFLAMLNEESFVALVGNEFERLNLDQGHFEVNFLFHRASNNSQGKVPWAMSMELYEVGN